MNRRSQRSVRLSTTLVKQGHHDASPRRLERWCTNGLGPAAQLDFGRQVAHFAQLAVISRSGRDADVTARRLAARGFACDRLRPSILRELGIDPAGTDSIIPSLDLSSGPAGDAGFASIEHLAHWMEADTGGLPPLMKRVIEALARNAILHAEELGDSAEMIFHSFIVNGLAHLMGGDYYNGAAIAAVLNRIWILTC